MLTWFTKRCSSGRSSLWSSKKPSKRVAVVAATWRGCGSCSIGFRFSRSTQNVEDITGRVAHPKTKRKLLCNFLLLWTHLIITLSSWNSHPLTLRGLVYIFFMKGGNIPMEKIYANLWIAHIIYLTEEFQCHAQTLVCTICIYNGGGI